MLKKYVSVVIIPRRTSEVKKIKIPVYVLGIAGLLIVGLISGVIYIAFDYVNLKSQIAGLDELQQVIERQEKRIKDFNSQYDELQLHFNHLSNLNDKLKSMVITSIDSQRKSKLRSQDEDALKQKLETASKTSILDAIASDTSEIDSDLKYEQELRFTNLISFFNSRKNPFMQIPAELPLNGYMISEFGMQTDPYTGQMRPQNGISIASRLDFPIRAPASGIVMEIKQDEDLGNILVVDHGNGYITRYGHLGRYDVDVGDIVKKGNVIALVGNSGRTTGPRLYYEIIFNGVPQNPVKYLNN